MRILLVEDDESVAEVLKTALETEHYAVDIAADGQMGWQMVSMTQYDLVLLDVVLPKLSGLDLCKQIRERSNHVSILLVTSLVSSQEKILGLNAGADGYITKPFDRGEILAHIRALLRRQNTTIVSVLHWGRLQLEPDSRHVTYRDRTVHLTPKEFVLLELFIRNPLQVFSRSSILDRLWSYSDSPGEETVTSHIKGLRKKLSDVGAPSDLIQTVYGVGYQLKPKPEKTRQKIEKVIATLWCSAKPRQLARVKQLISFAEMLRLRQLSGDERYKAYQLAHSLSGTLGIFGLFEGSKTAQQIEKVIAGNAPISTDEQAQIQVLLRSLDQTIQQFSQSPSPIKPVPPAKEASQLPLLLLIDAKLELVPDLVKALWANSLTVKVSSDINGVRDLFAQLGGTQPSGVPLEAQSLEAQSPEAQPDIIILKFSTATTDFEALDQLIGAARPVPELEAMVYSVSNRLSDRVKIARLGNYPFFYRPTVTEALSSIKRVRSRKASRILIVDDDVETLETLQRLLSQKGLQIETLKEPSHFWQRLQATAPDLLLLDIEMPQFSGLDLCQVVRQAPGWGHLPIIFLTAHSDSETERAAINAGANDLLEKALPTADLVTRLIAHVERANLQQLTSAIALGISP